MTSFYFVWCLLSLSILSSIISPDSVRLVNGTSLCSGRLEVKSNKSIPWWSSVCEADFDQQDAEVVCRELGCGAPSVLQGALYGEVEDPMWTKEFQCGGTESALLDCRSSGLDRNTCSPGKAVGLTCSEPVRLVGGDSRCAGTLEVNHGDWRPVDYSFWTLRDAAIACRQLDCGSAVSVEMREESSYRSVWRISSDCVQSGSALRECAISDTWPYILDITCSDSVRLVNGTSLCSGRLEVKSNHSNQWWSSVCEADFDQQDAEVVCRELGCGAPSVLQGSLYGEVEDTMWTKEFQCGGNESVLLDCRSSGSDRNTCSPGKAVGLTCSESVRLVGRGSRCAGTLEVKHGDWRPVRYDDWTLREADVACRELDCGSAVSVEERDESSDRSVWWIRSDCIQSGSSLRDCALSYSFSSILNLTCSDLLLQPNIAASSSVDGVSEAQQQGFQVLRGFTFTISCSTQQQYPGGSFQLTFTSSTAAHTYTQPAVNHSSHFLFPAAEPAHQGSYSCVYHVYVFSHDFFSESRLLSLTVTDLLLQPNISASSSVDGVSEAQQQGFQVLRDFTFTISCSTKPQFPGGSFQLTFTSSTSALNYIQPAVNHSAHFLFPAAEPAHQGSYSCVYHVYAFSHDFFSESRLISLTVTDLLLQPNISASSYVDGVSEAQQQGFQVLRGSTFTISCSTQPQYSGGSFQLTFTSSTSALNYTKPAFYHSAHFLFPAAEPAHQGSYSCVYHVYVFSHDFFSESRLLSLTVADMLLQPNISASSSVDGVSEAQQQGFQVLRGSTFTISCSTQPQYPGGSFQLTFTSSTSALNYTKPAVNHSAHFLFPAAEPAHQGSYSCVYHVYIFSHDFFSESRLISLTVTDMLLQPNISASSSVDGVSEAQQQGFQVLRGSTFTISCSTQPQYPGGSFQLTFTSSTSALNYTQPAVNHSAHFLFPAAEPAHQGSYSCVYHVYVFSHDFFSESRLLSLTVTDLLLQPNISASSYVDGVSEAQQQGFHVLRGSNFTISCSIQPQYPGGSFQLTFTSSTSAHTYTQPAVNHSAHFLFPAAEPAHQGSHSCVYHVYVFSHDFFSESRLLSLTVTDMLLQPNISASSSVDGVSEAQQQGFQVLRGSTFTISCSTQPQYPGGSFQLTFTSSTSALNYTQPAVNHSAHFLFPAAEPAHQGSYSCVYHVYVFSHDFFSESRLLSLTVADLLLQPNISGSSSVDGVSEAQQQGFHVLRDFTFTISCSIQPQYPGGSFQLNFNSSTSALNYTEPAVNHSAHFLFPAAEPAHQGSYSCVYHVYVFSHNFSSESRLISLTVADLRPLIIRAIVLPLILLLANIGFYFYYKTTRGQRLGRREKAEPEYYNLGVPAAEGGPTEEEGAQGAE
ncbi:uncharacterized protein LOC119474418 [Sebastes umbrosus]|uniref:uncharacterized protein LOC119474418 n=1 Tax=Sebastes umbrosus TaxID=72105 RepID=UPI00189E2FCA|nr:uncharacterized protein LOC119474418 [Sebastes umbrosus]